MYGRRASRDESGTPRPAALEVGEPLGVKGAVQDSRRYLWGLSVTPLSSGLKEGGRASKAALDVSPGTGELGGEGVAQQEPLRLQLAGDRGSLAGLGKD